MSNGGKVLVYKHEGDCESDEVIHESIEGGLLGWETISDVEVGY